jgi:hypothetical protein
LRQAKSLKWTETVVSRPDVAVGDAVVPDGGAVTEAPEDPDADEVATGAVTVGVEDVVVQPAIQASSMTSTARLIRGTKDFIMCSI